MKSRRSDAGRFLLFSAKVFFTEAAPFVQRRDLARVSPLLFDLLRATPRGEGDHLGALPDQRFEFVAYLFELGADIAARVRDEQTDTTSDPREGDRVTVSITVSLRQRGLFRRYF
jgi:hypothetical protein